MVVVCNTGGRCLQAGAWPEAAVQLPASVQHVFAEAADNVRRSRLTVLTAVKHAFAGMFTREITAALARQGRSSAKAPPAPVSPEDESLVAAAEHAGAADGKYKSVLKSVAASVTWKRPKTGAADRGNGHEARAAQVVHADAGLNNDALAGLLDVINREFQVRTPPHLASRPAARSTGSQHRGAAVTATCMCPRGEERTYSGGDAWAARLQHLSHAPASCLQDSTLCSQGHRGVGCERTGCLRQAQRFGTSRSFAAVAACGRLQPPT